MSDPSKAASRAVQSTLLSGLFIGLGVVWLITHAWLRGAVFVLIGIAYAAVAYARRRAARSVEPPAPT